MRRFSDLSFRNQLTLAIVTTSALVLVMASVLLVVYERQTYRDKLVSEAASIGQIVGSSSAAALMFGDAAAANEILSGLRAEPRVTGAALFSSEGVLVASFVRPGASDSLVIASLAPPGSRFAGNTLVVSQYIDVEGDRIGSLQIAFDGSEMEQRLAGFSLAVMIGLFLSILVAVGLSAAVQRSLSGPILSLARAARRVSEEKDYTVRAPDVPGRELGTLTRAFNDMLDQIEERNGELHAAHAELEVKVGRTGP